MPDPLIDIGFDGIVVEWRGPAPYVFVAIPDEQVGEVRWAAREASYGWGCVPIEAELRGERFTTSLFPREGGYLLPLKVAVRTAAQVALGDTVAVRTRVMRAA